MPGSLWDRLRDAMVKPADGAGGPPGADGPGKGAAANPAIKGGEYPTTVPELETLVKRADDRERLIGFIAAPIAAALGFIISASLVANDPKRLLADGRVNPLHVSPSLYVELGAVSVALAVVMLVTALLRKRLYLAVTMALYGLAIFNLHFWGFGLPYIFAGAWLMVRSYRLQTKLKEARAAAPEGGRGATSKRYTPPTPSRRPPKPKPGGERKAG
jgi:hypothetical protein